MSGPPYPRPQAGDNAIGRFIIGVSPIGSIAAFDYWRTIISQYANSPILTQLITDFFGYIDQTANMDAFFDLVWNIDTAQGWGLDVWGRIIGITRVLSVPLPDMYLGFHEAGDANEVGFNQAPWFAGQPVTSNFALSDSAYRVLLFAKALANISDGSIPAINQLLLNLFPNRGNCYVVDNGDMSLTYKFEFFLAPFELAIVGSSGVLPTPCGVAFDIETAAG